MRTWSETCFSLILEARSPTDLHTCCATRIKVNSRKSFLPNKAARSSADDGPIPHFGGGDWDEPSLVTLGSSGFPLRSVLVYSETNPHTVYPDGGGNTPVIFEHHRKHTSASIERIKPPHAVPEVQNKDSQLENAGKSKLSPGDVKTLSLTAEVKQYGCFYARPPCVLRPGGVFVLNPAPPASVEILWAWSMCWSFLPLGAHCKKQKSPMCTRCVRQL